MIPGAHPNPKPKRHLELLAVLAQMTAECPYTLQWAAPSPIKIAPYHWGMWLPTLRQSQVTVCLSAAIIHIYRYHLLLLGRITVLPT